MDPMMYLFFSLSILVYSRRSEFGRGFRRLDFLSSVHVSRYLCLIYIHTFTSILVLPSAGLLHSTFVLTFSPPPLVYFFTGVNLAVGGRMFHLVSTYRYCDINIRFFLHGIQLGRYRYLYRMSKQVL
jgi:hypothetical protein